MAKLVLRARVAHELVEFELATGTYGVGRSAENAIVLDDISISRRHARITVEGDAIYVEDLGSSGGTAVAGERMAARTPRQIQPGDALRFGAVEASVDDDAPAPTPEDPAGAGFAAALPATAGAGLAAGAMSDAPGLPDDDAQFGADIFESADSDETPPDTDFDPPTDPSAETQAFVPPPAVTPSPAQGVPMSAPPPMPAFEPAPTAPVFQPEPPPVTPQFGVRLSLVEPPSSVEPGSAVTLPVSLVNRGSVVEEVVLTISGLPPEWVSISPQQVTLMPGVQSVSTVTVRPPKNAEALAGNYPYTVVARSVGSGAEAIGVGTLGLGAFEAVTASLEPSQSTRDFRMNVVNSGNAAAMFSLAGMDDEEALQFNISPAQVEVPAGQSTQASIRVRPRGKKWTGPQEIKPFKIALAPAAGGAAIESQGRLVVKPLVASPGKWLALLAVLGLAIGIAAGLYFFLGGEDDEIPIVPDPTETPTLEPTPTEEAVEVVQDVHLCEPGAGGPPPPPGSGFVRDLPPALVSFLNLEGQDPTAPLFMQNDERWANVEYAKAGDDNFRHHNSCGSTISQCGCAMTSVVSVMSIFQVAVMPDGQTLTPEQYNNWLNQDARLTESGWVSRGYIYGNVIWPAVNQLTAEIARAIPGTQTVRYKSTGSGSEEQIRAELRAGRPVVLEVPGHFVAAIGIDPETNEILINDPFYPERNTLAAYRGQVRRSVLFEASDDLSALVVTVPSGQRVRLIDSNGHVAGTFDGDTADEAAQRAIRDIPGVTYTFQHSWRDPNCIEQQPGPEDGVNQIILTGPAAGRYRIEVYNPSGEGTGGSVHLFDEDGNLSMGSLDSDQNNLVFDIEVDRAGPPPTEAPPTEAPPTSTPVPGATNTPPPTATNTPTATPTATVTPTDTPTNTPTPTPTSTPTATPTMGHTAPTGVTFQCSIQKGEQTHSTAEITLSCTGTAQTAFETNQWYVIEDDGSRAELTDYRNSRTMRYTTMRAIGSSFRVEFRACNGDACRSQTATFTIVPN